MCFVIFVFPGTREGDSTVAVRVTACVCMFAAIGSQGRSSVSVSLILKHTFLEVRADAEVLNDGSKRGAGGIDSGGCVDA